MTDGWVINDGTHLLAEGELGKHHSSELVPSFPQEMSRLILVQHSSGKVLSTPGQGVSHVSPHQGCIALPPAECIAACCRGAQLHIELLIQIL